MSLSAWRNGELQTFSEMIVSGVGAYDLKRIDLHIHTISTDQDASFEFSPEVLARYVAEREIDAIAITNHNVFDLKQFHNIETLLTSATVFPGIEIDFEGGHLLLISDAAEVNDFAERADDVSKRWTGARRAMTATDLRAIFGDLSRFLLIPHYRKKPEVAEEAIRDLSPYVTAGEVTSPRKFKYCIADKESLVPVVFSDCRMDVGLDVFPTRITYIDSPEISFAAVRLCLGDKAKVALSAVRGHDYFDALPNGLKLRNGLNVVLGERSSGKTYTLDLLSESFDNVKYVKQFALLERDPERDKQQFEELLTRGHSVATQEYLSEFRAMVDEVANVSLEQGERQVHKYLESLKQYASEVERQDSFSSTRLYGEALYPEARLDSLRTLISSVQTILDSTEYRTIIEQFVSIDDLKRLVVRLMEEYATRKELALKKVWANDLVESIQRTLKLHTATPEIRHVDLYQVTMDRRRIERFTVVANALKRERKITEKQIQGFKIVARVRPFDGAGELKAASGRKLAFSAAYQEYEAPYQFLKSLREIESLDPSDYYKFFAKVEYKVLNRYGFEVSGGERSEFRLLQQISDAQNHEMLLIDEPESSFDNVFLRDEVNQLIKDISASVPVVVVTHNNTVGASIRPDYVIYTKREFDGGTVNYRFYCGSPSDKNLVSPRGATIRNFNVLMDCLEAGEKTYADRGHTYEILKD